MGKGKNGFIECDYCGELFVEGEPFCPYCGKPVEEIIEAQGKKLKTPPSAAFPIKNRSKTCH